MTMALGTKNKTAASIHKLIEEAPLCEAAAIQRGPRTVAILKRRTSQNPISLRSCLIGSEEEFAGALKGSRPRRESVHPACGNCAERGLWSFQNRPRTRTRWLCLPARRPLCRLVFSPDGYRGSPRWRCGAALPSIAKLDFLCGRP